jgi:transposase
MDLPMETACTYVAWIGIDVSEATLDVCLLNRAGKRHYKQFKNETSGFAKLLRWTRSLCPQGTDLQGCVHFCMESTGPYSTGLALYLAEEAQTVSVENPARVKHFGQSQGVLNKTDKADANVIADYARLFSPAPWRMSTLPTMPASSLRLPGA